MKQYTVEPAYTGNVRVEKFIDGRCVDYQIINDYALLGYKTALEHDGYERAYDVKAAEALMREKYAEYQEALKWYKYASAHALRKNNKEEQK